MSKSRRKSSATFFTTTHTQKSWLELENEENSLLPRPRKIMQLFWDNRIIKYNKEAVDEFKNFIKESILDESAEEKIEQLFDDAVNAKISFEEFANKIENFGAKYIYAMNDAEKLIIIPEKEIQDLTRPLSVDDIFLLRQYIKDQNISAAITLRSDDGPLITPDFLENQSSASFAMHSVGKVFTAMLLFLLIRKGIMSEKDLHRPIELSDEIKQQLPATVRERIKHVTLHQLMTHHAGIGDYLKNYEDTIKKGTIPTIRENQDFIPFIEDQVFPINRFKYSNAGILLVGLAIAHAYEKKLGKKCDYNNLLQQYILNPSGIVSFSPWRPENSKTNPKDKIGLHFVGSPAGGYWINVEDLAKFGQWIYNSCKADSKLKRLVQKYGQEFYNPNREFVAHGGAIPSSSAYLFVSLKTGAVIAILSNQPDMAFVLHTRIQKNIIADKGIDITDKEMANSTFGQEIARRFKK